MCIRMMVGSPAVADEVAEPVGEEVDEELDGEDDGEEEVEVIEQLLHGVGGAVGREELLGLQLRLRDRRAEVLRRRAEVGRISKACDSVQGGRRAIGAQVNVWRKEKARTAMMRKVATP